MLTLSCIAAVIFGLGRPRSSLASLTATIMAEAMTRVETYRESVFWPRSKPSLRFISPIGGL